MSNFYGTEIKIWAGFGQIGSTEKQFGPIMINFEDVFFMFSLAKKNVFNLKKIIASALKMKVKCFKKIF